MKSTDSEQHPFNQIEIDSIQKSAFTVHMHAGAFHIPWHAHQPHQLVYAEEGVLNIQTERRAFLLPARHAAWIPANCVHGLRSQNSELQLWSLYFKQRECEPEILSCLGIFAISTLAREMIMFTSRWPFDGAADAVECSFYETIRLVAAEWCSQPLPLVLPIPQDRQLVQVTTYTQKHLATQLSASSVAAQYAMSSRTLMRQFQKHLGMTFGAYLRTARMAKAIDLLTQPSMSVTEVAYAVGYRSLSSFTQAFRQVTGLRPSEYMHQKRK